MVLTNQLIYLVNLKTIRKIFSNYVCFSKSPNFTMYFGLMAKLWSLNSGFLKKDEKLLGDSADTQEQINFLNLILFLIVYVSIYYAIHTMRTYFKQLCRPALLESVSKYRLHNCIHSRVHITSLQAVRYETIGTLRVQLSGWVGIWRQ